MQDVYAYRKVEDVALARVGDAALDALDDLGDLYAMRVHPGDQAAPLLHMVGGELQRLVGGSQL
jgi:hypothetical protein